ncbi:unnamed protein product [Urochloa decumbens]|uniref:RING-type domain-containing protein n=1 Tax=Urochloa decumbens TaxID=240449 RepID=A0ABC8XIY4_9POAL
MKSAVLSRRAPTAAGAVGGGGFGGVVRLKRSLLAACLTCPLCGLLLRDAATITECLHTFCRKCISEEFINKEVCCCPICSIDLGCAPLEKLRIDHSIQYIRSKIFPKKQKVEVAEVTASVTPPIKRKERSLSSLTIHTPQVSVQKCLTKRRTKASCLHSLSLHSKLRGSDITKKVGGWRPLVDETPTSQAKAKRQFTRCGNLEKRTGREKLLILKEKQKKIKPKLPIKKRKFRTLWFCLIAAYDRLGQYPLPQIPSNFLRIKDVDLPASFIQKYLVQKLNLSSESEVDLLCGGNPVSPGMTMHDLADSWLKIHQGRVRTYVHAPASRFATVVYYRRPGESEP